MLVWKDSDVTFQRDWEAMWEKQTEVLITTDWLHPPFTSHHPPGAVGVFLILQHQFILSMTWARPIHHCQAHKGLIKAGQAGMWATGPQSIKTQTIDEGIQVNMDGLYFSLSFFNFYIYNTCRPCSVALLFCGWGQIFRSHILYSHH